MGTKGTDSYREEILASLTEYAKQLINHFEGSMPINGSRHLNRFSDKRTTIGGRSVLSISEESAKALIEEAKTSHAAFDLAKHLAGLSLLGQLESRLLHRNRPLQHFAARCLIGEIKRPPQRGRKDAGDLFLRVMQFGLCKVIERITPYTLTRSHEGVNENFSACDLVAQAFSNAGRHTTYERLESYCHAKNYQHIRDLAKFLELD